MRREDFKNAGCVIRGNVFGKPDLNRVVWEGHTLMVKDVKDKPFLFRWTVGLYLIEKEWRIYSRLAGIQGIPRIIERIDRFTFAMEFVPGRPVQRGDALSPSFFPSLEGILKEVHARGIVHLDLRHKGNILVSEGGRPFLVDFNSAVSFNAKGPLRRFLFPLLQWIDRGGLLKLKSRISPASMTAREKMLLKRFNRIRRLWIFN